MKKGKALLCAAVLLSLSLTSCGSGTSVKESRVELTKSGRIIEYTVEDFSSYNYDMDEFEEFVEDEIDEYSANHNGRIKVQNEKLKKDTAYLTIRYNKAETYSEFNGVECFSGTIAEALEAGYDFSKEFVVALKEESRDSSDEDVIQGQTYMPGQSLISDDSLKVFIIETDENVKIPGEVQYYYTSLGSAGWKSKDTVQITADGDKAFGESNVVYVLYN